jgi:nucleoside-diphosphate-sugar epimerase
MKILVTGATGFIGSRLVRELVARGERPLCLVRARSNSGFLKALGAEPVYGDVTDERSLSSLPSCDVIFHCAALVRDNNLARLRACNVKGTENICRLAQRMAVQRLVHVSSVAVVSANPDPLITEGMPFAATNNYGVSKIESEQLVRDFRKRGLPCAIIRPPVVYGEREPHAQELLFRLLSLRLLPLIDNGEHRIHMAYVGNVVAGLLLAMERREFLEGSFFCADRDALTAAEALGILAAAINAPAPLRLSPRLSSLLIRLPWAGKRAAFFRKDRIYDTGKIVAAGYADALPASEALARTGSWWQSNRQGRSTR